MKKHFLTMVLSVATVLASAQTATNFNCNDCSNVPHELFAELDAGKVIVLVANTSCTSLNSWKNSTGLTNAVTFSDAAINMGDYGSAGMPKIVVLGGGGHTVFYNVNNTVNITDLQDGIDAALLATGIQEQSELASSLNVYPDPIVDNAQIKFTLAERVHQHGHRPLVWYGRWK